jgi:dTDP-4-amino-4,6-dideoxygalactose transaminase
MEKLLSGYFNVAKTGGHMDWKVPLSDIDLGPDELQAVQNVLASKWLSMGEVTETFEQHFAASLGVPYAIAVSNGTAALHIALQALGIGTGDEVIVPALTFVASANAILYVGATPVFADVTSPDDLCIAPQAIQQVITPATKAVLVVHYGGYSVDMASIRAAIDGRNIAIVEDAAHAPGAELDGRKLGGVGDVGCFSFFANKNMTTGEGGMLTTSRQDISEHARRLRSHGMTTVTWDRHRGHAYSYDVVELGFNYRTSELNAALGITQLQKLPANTRKRRRLVEQYHERLRTIAGIVIPFQAYRGEPAFHLLPILLNNSSTRTRVMQHLKAGKIQTSIHYPPVHQFSFYQSLAQGHSVSLPTTENVGERQLTLPLYANMTENQVDHVCDCLAEALQKS